MSLLLSDFWLDTELQKRFWRKVKRCAHGWRCKDCCWEWQATKVKDGYGQFSLYGIVVRATWVGFILFKKKHVIRSKHMLHKCDNPPCVNPWHLRPGTNKDNVDDKVSKGREWHPKGSLHGEAKLTEWKVQEIRRLFVTNNFTTDAIATRYGVSGQLIKRILRRKAWEHVQDELQPQIDSILKRRNEGLPDKEIIKIRTRYATGKYSLQFIADRYGVNQSLIYLIVHGKLKPSVGGPVVTENLSRGARNIHAKLDEEKVREIRRLTNMKISQRAIAEQFNVSQRTITLILKNITWAHVT